MGSVQTNFAVVELLASKSATATPKAFSYHGNQTRLFAVGTAGSHVPGSNGVRVLLTSAGRGALPEFIDSGDKSNRTRLVLPPARSLPSRAGARLEPGGGLLSQSKDGPRR